MFYLIGDVHIGRKFKTGVPLNRRGEREEMFYTKFKEEIAKGINEVKVGRSAGVVQLGDLFDTFSVGYTDLFKVMSALYEFEINQVHAYFLAGNHDLAKDQTKISALKALQHLTNGWNYVHFIIDHPFLFSLSNNQDQYGLMVPFSHTQTLEEQLEPFAEYKGKIQYMYGHFEEPYTDVLRSWAKEIYTGHIHTPRQDGNILVKGSILPITFGEDPNQDYMITCTLDQLQDWAAKSHNLCFRVKLKEDEVLPTDFDCLQMIKYTKEYDVNDPEALEVSYAELDMEKLFHEALDEVDLFDEFYQSYLNSKMEEANNVQ